jgi:hypothetical protein
MEQIQLERQLEQDLEWLVECKVVGQTRGVHVE